MTPKTIAKQYNAELEITSFDGINYTIEVTAPDGFVWVESDAVSLVSRFWSYDKESKKEAQQDIINRMQQGITKE